MSNNFEYQSNCLSNDNIKSEPNEEEDTEDMSEDIDEEGDKHMSIERVVNTEEETKTVPKRDFSGTIKVVEVPTVQQKNNEMATSAETVADSGQTIGRRVCVSINCQQFCGRNVAYCPTCLTNINQLMDKQLLIRSQAVVNPQRQVLIRVCKCSVKGCTTLCLDETALKLHLETEHKSVIVDSVENKGDDIEDMSEDIDKQGDELMSAEDNNQSIAEPKNSQTKPNVKVMSKSGNTSKAKPELNVLKKRKLLPKPVSVGSGQTAQSSTLASMVKCIIVGCDSLCRDQNGLERHLESVHRLMYIKGPTPASSATSVRTTCSAPVLSRPSLPSQPSPLIYVNPVMDKSKTSIGRGCHLEKQTKEVILNLNQYFSALFLKENKQTIMAAIEMATKISFSSIEKTIREFKDTGNLKAVVRTKKRERKYKYIDEDRDILSRVLYKLRDENRLRGYVSVYNEIKTSKEFNPTFKKCGIKAFSALFKRFGFRISDTRIYDIKPSDSERERMACQRPKESKNDKYVCDWPGCHKQFNCSQHVIIHLRTHTKVKPFVCRFPKCDYRCAVSGNFTKHLKCHNKTVFPDDENEEMF